MSPTPMERVEQAHQITLDAQHAAEAQVKAEIQFFRSALAKLLTIEELQQLADQCGEELGPDHCVYCAAWELAVEQRA